MENSRKRRRVDVDEDDSDRLSDLPDCLLLEILSRVGSRLAVQTSVLSRRWRHLWRDVPCADVDEREFSAVSSSNHGRNGHKQHWARFEDFADQLLSPPPPHRRLDAFRLHITRRIPCYAYATTDRWVRRGLARSPAAVAIHAPDPSVVRWITPPQSSSSLLSRLTKLHLFGVYLGQLLGCPALEELHLERCGLGHRFRAMASPVLRRLAVVRPIGGHLVAADLIRAAPRLEYLRVELVCDGDSRAGDPAPEGQAPLLPSVSEASIRITSKRERKRNKLEFFGAMRCLLARLPNVVYLDLSGFATTGLLEEESQEFPRLNQLKTLRLDRCEVGVCFHALTRILRNTPNLETMRLHQCKFIGSIPKRRKPSKRRGSRTAALHECKNLKLIEIKSRQDEPRTVRLLTNVFEEMPLAPWRLVDKVSDVAGLMTMQFHRTEVGLGKTG
ncbi:MEIOTIC F-BOX protein MOF [Brachypodium distachyon]|uniref:F-box domain-containing protein n=1 Tax=Brachypodium distachyon TaxID=15368 RepID=A0A0Q3RP65_BRADI|nr:MEIOTIC F-BOX protein MOF [Brachypodium distachyon]KQK14778.2 hypothetical protein BRADI_1g18520v3 [Brachypodium distachyon]|eukprot:XP_014752086.1 MEIOTIC F-BOX protein MOF [Brachypodium distachyon]